MLNYILRKKQRKLIFLVLMYLYALKQKKKLEIKDLG